jgi:hypothetical protein
MPKINHHRSWKSEKKEKSRSLRLCFDELAQSEKKQ